MKIHCQKVVLYFSLNKKNNVIFKLTKLSFIILNLNREL